MRQRAPRRPAAERRRIILDSACAVFAEHGYAGSGTGDVARAAGVAPAALYRYFPTKRDLYLATLRDAGPRLLEIWQETAAASPTALDLLWNLGLQYFDHVEGRSPYVRLWFQAMADAADPEVREVLAANFTAMVDALARPIAAGQSTGTVRPDIDPRIAAWHFVAIGLSFDLIHTLGLGAELDRAAVERWGTMYLDSIRNRE